jgi:aspartokinase-like uncharacterized kinase
MCDLVVVGGGELVESIRRFDVAHGLCEQEAHWLAIDAMSVSARLVAALLPEAKLQLRVQPCFELDLSILDVRDFMQQDASSADALPETWAVTSDSIAARIAERIGAAELVLLKSTLPEVDKVTAATLETLAAVGYVDGFLAKCASAKIPLRCVNLRDGRFSQVMISARQLDAPSPPQLVG